MCLSRNWEFRPKRYIRLPVTALMKEIGRSFHRHYGVEASLESILGRIWIKELFSSRRVSHQFDASIRDIPFEGAHTIDQALRETDRVVQDRFVNVRVTPIMGTTRVYDAALVRVVCHRQTWKDTFKNVGKKGIQSIQPGCTRYPILSFVSLSLRNCCSKQFVVSRHKDISWRKSTYNYFFLFLVELVTFLNCVYVQDNVSSPILRKFYLTDNYCLWLSSVLFNVTTRNVEEINVDEKNLLLKKILYSCF